MNCKRSITEDVRHLGDQKNHKFVPVHVCVCENIFIYKREREREYIWKASRIMYGTREEELSLAIDNE